MAHHLDLSDCDGFGDPPCRLKAVGWLDAQTPYPRGHTTRDFFDALAALAVDPWEPAALLGRHECPFCVFTGGPATLHVGEVTVSLGTRNLFVPDDDAVFVAPSLILHYVDAHQYAPPAEFQRAVARCPPMRSMDYLKAIRAHGLHRLRDGRGIRRSPP